jgi:hypothetical protein
VILPQDSAVKPESNDQVLCTSSPADSEVYLPHHPKDQPEVKQNINSKEFERDKNEGEIKSSLDLFQMLPNLRSIFHSSLQ